MKIGLSDVRFISSIQVENSSDKCTAEREREREQIEVSGEHESVMKPVCAARNPVRGP